MDVMAEVGSCCVAEVMGTELFTLTPDTAVSSARRLVLENGVDHVLILENGTLAGIVGREDLRHADSEDCVGDCMTSPVLCITPDTTLQEAVDIMGENDVDCLPVVMGVLLIGIVTREALAVADSPELGKAASAAAALSGKTCDACGSRDSVFPVRKGVELSFCARCRRTTATNGRC